MEDFFLLEGEVAPHVGVLFSPQLHGEENEIVKESEIALALDFKFRYFACE